MLHELECAKRVRDALQIVALSVCEVIHGIGIPLIARADVRDIQHAIDERVAEEHVGVGHINLGSQHECSRFALAAIHELEQL